MIERAYQLAEACGIPLWNQDEAGPYATRPQPGGSWQPRGHPKLQPHEYLRDGGAKLMTLFRPETRKVINQPPLRRREWQLNASNGRPGSAGG